MTGAQDPAEARDDVGPELITFRLLPGLVQGDGQIPPAHQGVWMITAQRLLELRDDLPSHRFGRFEISRIAVTVSQVDGTAERERVTVTELSPHPAQGVVGKPDGFSERAATPGVARQVVRGHQRVRVIIAQARSEE